MTAATPGVPEPLLAFDDPSDAVNEALQRLDPLWRRYVEHRDAGRILPNSIEAVRVELTYHSNAIEGSTLTLRETQLVLEGLTPTSGKSMRELYEARNHDRALRLIEQWVGERPDAPVSEKDLLDVHARVLADIDDASAGRLRAERVLIKGTRFIPPGAHKFDVLLPAIFDLANRSAAHPMLKAAELHYNIVAVHPFTDGNGRTARLMMNYALLRAGYPLAIIEVERRQEYLQSLEEANAGRWSSFAEFIIDSAGRSIQKLLGD